MTDSEIIECAENCLSESPSCLSCPFDEGTLTVDECMSKLLEKLVEVVKRQNAEIDILIQKKNYAYDEIAELKAEIERLQKNCQQMDAEVSKLERELAKNIVLSIKYIPLTNERICAVGWDSALVEKIKTEAIKEFAERLKEHTTTARFEQGKYSYEIITAQSIDNLVKEMTE